MNLVLTHLINGDYGSPRQSLSTFGAVRVDMDAWEIKFCEHFIIKSLGSVILALVMKSPMRNIWLNKFNQRQLCCYGKTHTSIMLSTWTTLMGENKKIQMTFLCLPVNDKIASYFSKESWVTSSGSTDWNILHSLIITLQVRTVKRKITYWAISGDHLSHYWKMITKNQQLLENFSLLWLGSPKAIMPI